VLRRERIPYGWKLFFPDGTVLNWYPESRRKTVHAEKNPRGHRLPAADPTGEGILAAMGLQDEPEARRLLGLPACRRTPAPRGLPEVAFDGGCRPNPGPGGWAVVLDDGRELSGAERHTTNNRMELTAAIRALEATRGPVRLLGDSAYVVRGATQWLPGWVRRGWRKANGQPVENADLWKRLWELLQGRQVQWELVRGHRGHPLNERCDRLVAEARRRAG
jgi:ribonuclease HI